MKHLILILCSSLMFLSCEHLLLGPESAPPPPSTLHSSRLATVLDSLRYALDVPALAGAIITDSGVVEARAVGCRRYGGPVNVTDDDQFHLGSCGKSFTAVMVGLLVDDGLVQWTTTLPTIFPEYANSMRGEYKDVTIRDLLSHAAGFMRDANVQLHTSSPREQRKEIVDWALRQPATQPRGTYLYSNLGFVIAGAVIERVADRPYEEIVFERVIRPLGLTSAGIGQMGSPGLEDQPLQHSADHSPIIATPDAHLAYSYDPAGMLHMSVGDWGRYCAWVLACDAGHGSLLRAETAKTITTMAVSDGPYGGYALGWGVIYRTWGGGWVLSHSGSNGYNYAEVVLAPARRFGILVMTNQGAGVNATPTDPAVTRLIDFYLNGK